MINGVHALINTPDAEGVRAFIRDVLQLKHVDAGGGWLIFALPPAELGVHPDDEVSNHLYLMCDDLDATMRELKERGASFGDVSVERYGRVTSIHLPGGGELGLYQPSHPLALGV